MIKKSIIALTIGAALIGSVVKYNAQQERYMVDVIDGGKHDYTIVYNTGEKEVKRFEDELEAAESYTDIWYEIYGYDDEDYMVDVIPGGECDYTIVYNSGEREVRTFDSEIEAAESYSNVWYEIYGE